MGEKISVEELFHLFSLSTVCLANLSYSPQAALGLPTTPYKMKNCKLFCRGENNFSNCSFVCSLRNTARVKTGKKRTSKPAWKGRKLLTVCWNKLLKNYFPVSTVGFQSLWKLEGRRELFYLCILFWVSFGLQLPVPVLHSVLSRQTFSPRQRSCEGFSSLHKT